MYFHLPTLLRVLHQTFTPTHFHIRHALNVGWLMPLFFTVRGIVSCTRGLDRLFFPRYRGQPVVQPLYITGSPRSGTTLLHRLLSHDPQFTSTKLTHTIFPAVSLYKLFDAIKRIDPHIGRPFSRLIRRIERKGFSGWQGIHRTRLGEPEEDEQYFVYTMLTPVITLLYPFFDVLDEPFFVDKMSEDVQRKLMKYYRDCMQRHLYARGAGKTLLTKNTMLSGRIQATRNAFPDMRVVHVVRHPFEAIPSLLSMFEVPWKRLAPQTQVNSEAYRALACLFMKYYRSRLEMRATWPCKQYVEVKYRDLVADPENVVIGIYQTLGLTMSDAFRAALYDEAEKTRAFRSTHRYTLEAFGLSRDFIYNQIPDVFAAYGFEH